MDIKQQAIDAMAEYDAQIRAGGEPVYPQWAADFLKAEAQALIDSQANQIATDEAVLGMTPTNDKVDQSGADERVSSSAYWNEPYANAKDFANRNIGNVQNAYIGETGDHLDAGTAYAIAESMFSTLASTQPAPQAAQDVIAWSYEFNEFGDVWKRHVILNRPDGNAAAPTKHNGSEVRKVCALYATPQPFPAPAVQSGELPELPHLIPTDDLGIRQAMLEYARQAIAQTAPAVAGEAVPYTFRVYGELLRTQDNRITDQPMFIVQQKRSYVTEADYNDCYYEWRETESGDYAGPEDDAEEKRLNTHFKRHHEAPDGWKRYAMFDVWEFVTACFTEQGCKDYLAINGHNLKEPRIYAEGSSRNQEFRSIRNWLINLAAPSQGAKQ